MKSLQLKGHLRRALLKFDKGNFTKKRRELYEVLKIAEVQGWQWGHREMYGGGLSIQVADNLDVVAEMHTDTFGFIHIKLNKAYFRADFVPKELAPYNSELDAELKNEEALYGYELPRPWIHG